MIYGKLIMSIYILMALHTIHHTRNETNYIFYKKTVVIQNCSIEETRLEKKNTE